MTNQVKRPIRFGIVAAVNNESVLQANLASSSMIRQNVPLVEIRNAISASVAYNQGMAQLNVDVVIFSHQDVYFPKLWLQQLQVAIEHLDREDPSWAVLGVFGISGKEGHVGHCWSSGLQRILGGAFDQPVPVESVDELVIVLKKASGLVFDELLPGFHLYGTDIVQIAKAKGLSSYVIHAPVVHNSRPVKTLLGGYTVAYRYMQLKWHRFLPISTVIVPITASNFTLWRYIVKRRLRKLLSREVSQPSMYRELTGRELSVRLGFEGSK